MGLFGFGKSKDKKESKNTNVGRAENLGASVNKGSEKEKRLSEFHYEETIEFNGRTFRGDEIIDHVLPIEKRLEVLSPTCDGFYPHEILVLNSAGKFTNTDTEFKLIWWYKYGIKDMQSVLHSLVSKNALAEGSVSDAIRLEKVSAIKEELAIYGLKLSGKKDDLIARLVENVSEEELSAKFPKRPYIVTDFGKDLLKKYEWIPYIDSHHIPDLDIWNLTDLMQKSPHSNYRDVIWGHLNELLLRYLGEGNFGGYGDCKRTMAWFVEEEGKYELAFSSLCESIVCDLCPATKVSPVSCIYKSADNFFPYETSNLKVSPYSVTQIYKYAEKLGYNDEDTLIQKLIKGLSCRPAPYILFTPEEMTAIVMFEHLRDVEHLTKIYKAAENRFRKSEMGRKAIKGGYLK